MANVKYVTRSEDGEDVVFRQVEQDGVPGVVTEHRVGPLDEFLEKHPNANISGATGRAPGDVRNPMTLTVNEQLPDYLETVESVDAILQMKQMDERTSADRVYDRRIREILEARTGNETDATEEEGDGDDDEEE